MREILTVEEFKEAMLVGHPYLKTITVYDGNSKRIDRVPFDGLEEIYVKSGIHVIARATRYTFYFKTSWVSDSTLQAYAVECPADQDMDWRLNVFDHYKFPCVCGRHDPKEEE